MIDKYLPANPVVRAILIFVLSVALYALLAHFVFDDGIGVGGGIALGVFLVFFDYRKRMRLSGRDRLPKDGEGINS